MQEKELAHREAALDGPPKRFPFSFGSQMAFLNIFYLIQVYSSLYKVRLKVYLKVSLSLSK